MGKGSRQRRESKPGAYSTGWDQVFKKGQKEPKEFILSKIPPPYIQEQENK
jgi:hypothetical protein